MRGFSSLFLAAVLALSSPAGTAAAATKAAATQKVDKRPLAVNSNKLMETTAQKLDDGKRLNRKERKEVSKAELEQYKQMRMKGADEISNTESAMMLREYRLRNKKKRGLIRKREVSLANVLFPGVSPEIYNFGELVWINAGLVESRNTQVPYEYYHLPHCSQPEEGTIRKKQRQRRNLGSRLQGYDLKPAPFDVKVAVNTECSVMCTVNVQGKQLKFMRKLIERKYRVQLQLDTLPVLMRSKNYNYAIRGYPLGFKSPPVGGGPSKDIYLYNHLKFSVTYNDDVEGGGYHITGFDVHPVSIKHDMPAGKTQVDKRDKITSCSGMSVENDSSKYLALEDNGSPVPIVYSYDITWVRNDKLTWSDRWDVYLVGSPDDGIHYYSIVNSLMIILFMTGAISTIMVRTLRKDIAGYNEIQSIEDAQEETGWKLVHGDVFRKPETSPMILSIAVGTGAQIGAAFILAMLCAIFKLTNSLKKGQVLTSMILLYVLCGSVAGYVSARIYKFTEATAWKTNAILTATALPGAIVAIFTVLNMFLSVAGAATAVSFLTIIVLFLLWVCVSSPLVFLGSYIGLKAKTIEVPTKTTQIARIVPEAPWHMNPALTALMGGILPFGSVCIELAFIMSALWLHQIYYVMGFLLAVIAILAATCAQVSIVLCYLQLCAEDHRWWWRSFWNCASAGFYLYVYSLWFLSSRLDLVGTLPVVIYLTYMGMISIFFGLFCGAVGFLSSLWFTKAIYNALKVD